MSPPEVHKQNTINCDVFSTRSRSAFGVNEASCGAIPVHADVVVEISTSGTRAPIHFVEESAAFRGCSRARRTQQLEPMRHPWSHASSVQTPPEVVQRASSFGVSCTSHKHNRRALTPFDGACLTLLGVSTGLRTPGVDNWAVARALVESSVDLRTRNVRGMTPLHIACAAGQVRKCFRNGRSYVCCTWCD